MTDAFLRIENLTKNFGSFTALRDISLSVLEGEFVCFLGPSGCGKTTLLRAIAGLDIQTQGRIEQAGIDISILPPAERDFGIVFQSYALFPNLTVEKNVAYGLESRRAARSEVLGRVKELLWANGHVGKALSAWSASPNWACGELQSWFFNKRKHAMFVSLDMRPGWLFASSGPPRVPRSFP